MKELFKKKINKKSFYITCFVAAALVFGVLFGANLVYKSLLGDAGFSDLLLLGAASRNIKNAENSLNSNISSKIYDDDMCVHFMNVGKADCAYIKCKDKSILIDAADVEPNDFVVQYLKQQNVEKLDMVVMTHPHRDHIGQMAKVMQEFKVDKFVQADMPKTLVPTTYTYEKMVKTLIDMQIPVESVMADRNFNIGDLKINVLGPVNISQENMNDNSVVMKLSYKDISFLFMGDAAQAEEKDIIKHYGLYINYENQVLKGRLKRKYNNYKRINNIKNYLKSMNHKNNPLKANVLKVGHHGSNSSSTNRFLKLVKPDYAVLSTVSREDWGAPSGWRWRAVERLQKNCKKIYKTYESGNIVFLTDGKTIKVETEK